MKRTLTLLAFTCLMLIAFGCGTTEDIDEDVIEEDIIQIGTVTGEVQSIDSVPIQVRILKAGELIEQIETDGNYEFTELEEGDYTIQISAQGYETTELNATVVAAEGTISLEKVGLVKLDIPVAHILGMLEDDETGSPLAKATVQLTTEDDEKVTALTNNDGEFSFENLPTDQDLTLVITYTCYEDSEITLQPLSADQIYEVTLELTKISESGTPGPSEGLNLCSIAPDFELSDGNNTQHSLSDYTSDNNVVLVFYRGSW